jgi:hypothetical protein
MSTPKPAHRPAGTPDGGQFATTSRAEDTGVVLDDAVTPAETSTWEKLNAAYDARNQTNGEIERLSAQEMADNIRARFPTAVSLHLEDSDQGSHFAALRITDAAGNTLHHIGDDDGDDDQDADGDLDTLASNFDNDTVSPLLTNYGTRRAPDYRLDLAGHGTTRPELPKMARSEGMQAMVAPINQQATLAELRVQLTGTPSWTSTSVADQALPHVPLAGIHPNTPVYVDHPEIQAGAVRDKVLSADGTTEFRRRRDGVHPNEPYQMRFQTSRPIDDDEMHQMAGLVGYAYASKVRGESLDDPVRDSPYSFVVYADTTKSRRDDLGQALEEFEAELPKMVRDGSPIRTTDRTGPAGTRAVLGLNDPGLTFETYYDSVGGENA